MVVVHAWRRPTQPPPPPLTETPLRDVIIADTRGSANVLQSPGAIGRVVRIHVEGSEAPVRLDELLVSAGAFYWDASNSLGLAAGVGQKGFASSNQGGSLTTGARAYINGHADIAWRFSRDPATVSQVVVLPGHEATLLGAGSPGAALEYLTKAPTGTAFFRTQISATSTAGKRLVADGEWHAGDLQARAVLTTQRDDKTVEGVADGRDVLLLSATHPLGTGKLRMDLEYDKYTMPFPFGTAYAGGQFWLDQSYVDARANANRQYQRAALYFTNPVGQDMAFDAHAQRVASRRDETLLGFYDPKNAAELRGYYRLIDEENHQTDIGMGLSGKLALGGWQHQWKAVLQGHDEDRRFDGPQNISGFTLSLLNPVFPANLQSLALATRYVEERYQERGLGLADTMTRGDWELRWGLRRSAVAIDSSASAVTPPARVAEFAHSTAAVGLARRLGDNQRVWLSRTTSFLPNRGKLGDGSYLPPSAGTQYELGWQHQTRASELAVQVFDLQQTNLPGRDPNNPDAFVLVGSKRTSGLTLNATYKASGYKLTGSLTHQSPRVAQAVNATQGSELVGVPRQYGAIKLELGNAASWKFDAQVVGAASLPGDDVASFSAPGYAVVNTAISNKVSSTARWGAQISNLFDRSYVRALTGADNVWQGTRRKLMVWVEFLH